MEIGYEDIKVWLFAQSLSGEAKKWFRLLPTDSIPNFQNFERLFLSRWEEKKNPAQLLTQYNQLRMGTDDVVRNFLDRFNRIYNALPTQCKPLEGMAKLHYVEGFDDDFALLLREKRSTTVAKMMDDAIEVEVNLMASKKGKYRFDNKKVKEKSQPSTSQSSSDAKFDSVLRVMERKMERFSESDRQVAREKHEPIIRNRNFRHPRKPSLPPPPQILPRGQRNQIQNQTDQVRPPFQENLLDDEYAPQSDDHINQFRENESNFFFTKEEHDKCTQDPKEAKSEDKYCWGYQNTMVDFQRQMNLRNRAVPISNIPKKSNAEQVSTNKLSNATINRNPNDKGK